MMSESIGLAMATSLTFNVHLSLVSTKRRKENVNPGLAKYMGQRILLTGLYIHINKMIKPCFTKLKHRSMMELLVSMFLIALSTLRFSVKWNGQQKQCVKYNWKKEIGKRSCALKRHPGNLLALHMC